MVVPPESRECNTCATECLYLQQSSHLCSCLEKAAAGHHCGAQSLGLLATEKMGERGLFYRLIILSHGGTTPQGKGAFEADPSPCGSGDTVWPPGEPERTEPKRPKTQPGDPLTPAILLSN